MSNDDKKWMNLAILEAFRSKGTTGKNPPVGCVIAKNVINYVMSVLCLSGRGDLSA